MNPLPDHASVLPAAAAPHHRISSSVKGSDPSSCSQQNGPPLPCCSPAPCGALGPAAVCTRDGPALKDTPFWDRDQKVIVSHVGDRKRLIGVDLVNEILHCEKQLILQKFSLLKLWIDSQHWSRQMRADPSGDLDKVRTTGHTT